jgi:Flp pilus assembly pilin Flp
MSSLNRTQSKVRQHGQGMSEYIIIVALIAVGAIGVFTAFGGTIRNQVAGMSAELTGQSSADSITAAQSSAQQAVNAAQKVQNMGTYGQQQQQSSE